MNRPSRSTRGRPEPVPTGATPSGATPTGAPERTAAASHLYIEPVSFEGRSLEGAPQSGDRKELAQPLHGAEIPVEDIPRIEPDPAGPARKSLLKRSGGRPVADAYKDLHDQVVRHRLARATDNGHRPDRGTGGSHGVWTGDRDSSAALRNANARWSEFAGSQRTSTGSFGDEPRQLLHCIEYEATVDWMSRGRHVDPYRGADAASTIDRAHAARYTPTPRDWKFPRKIGYGRVSRTWNEFPISPREQLLNALSKGESLNPEQVAVLGSGFEGDRAAGCELSSSQYRAMVDMQSELRHRHRNTRWNMDGERGDRLLQLINLLDYAAAV